jgi:hypothetical protein
MADSCAAVVEIEAVGILDGLRQNSPHSRAELISYILALSQRERKDLNVAFSMCGPENGECL